MYWYFLCINTATDTSCLIIISVKRTWTIMALNVLEALLNNWFSIKLCYRIHSRYLCLIINIIQCLNLILGEYLFKKTSLSEVGVGAILLVISLLLMCICLFAIVKLLNSILKGKIRRVIKNFANFQFPGKAAYFSGYIAIVIGCGLTILVQSSSVFTSSLTPLVGAGVISIDRMYPLTLGANIGTTTTGILAALASDSDTMKDALQVAMCHMFFNLSGIVIFYPIPYLRFPIPMAKYLGTKTEKYRWFAIFYILVVFFLLPAGCFGLSLAGWKTMAGVLISFGFFIISIAVIKLFQRKNKRCLPTFLRDFKFLPKFIRSLEPYDRVLQKLLCCKQCKKYNNDVHV